MVLTLYLRSSTSQPSFSKKLGGRNQPRSETTPPSPVHESLPNVFSISCRPRPVPVVLSKRTDGRTDESIYHCAQFAQCAAEKWISITWGRSIAFLFSFTGIKGQPDYRERDARGWNGKVTGEGEGDGMEG